jgi:tetratricopeptide (TPR) repeat protein
MRDTAIADSTNTSVELEIHRIRDWMRAGRHAEALRAAIRLSNDFPDNRDVLYAIAKSQRYLNKPLEALSTLQRAEKLHAAYSRLYEERGNCYVMLRDAPRAIEAFLQAVNINPALPSSWSVLEGLYRLSGDATNAAIAASHVAKLKQLAPDIVRATSLFSDGELSLAENIIRAYLLSAGNDVEAMRLLARIGIERDVLDDAELLLEAVLAIAPDYQAARHDFARVLLERHKHAQAREQLKLLMQADPANLHYRALHASALVGLGEHDDATTEYRRLIELVPDAPDLHLSLAHALKTVGRRDESVQAYRAAIANRSNYGDAWWSLANLKTYHFSNEEIAQMQREEASPSTPPIDRYHLCFALGKAFEDRGEFEQSWRYYERGNVLKRAESRYRPEIIETNTRQQIETCTHKFFAERDGAGDPSPDPIFIVGLPRAGSTLLEQILASHSQIDGTQELADIPRIVLGLRGRDADLNNSRYPRVLKELSFDELAALGKKYLSDTRAYRGGKPFFIDKMPNNFRHVGLIRLILPNAKIIDARREPMACCFSNLKQLFALGQEFTYSVEDIARYYRTYLELMRHWDDVLPNRVLRVHHEDVVADLEGSVRRVLDFCGLPFEPACLDFHKNARSVRTASSEQVRQPIFREGLDQWKNYEAWLGPLKDVLGDALDRYRD